MQNCKLYLNLLGARTLEQIILDIVEAKSGSAEAARQVSPASIGEAVEPLDWVVSVAKEIVEDELKQGFYQT